MGASAIWRCTRSTARLFWRSSSSGLRGWSAALECRPGRGSGGPVELPHHPVRHPALGVVDHQLEVRPAFGRVGQLPREWPLVHVRGRRLHAVAATCRWRCSAPMASNPDAVSVRAPGASRAGSDAGPNLPTWPGALRAVRAHAGPPHAARRRRPRRAHFARLPDGDSRSGTAGAGNPRGPPSGRA